MPNIKQNSIKRFPAVKNETGHCHSTLYNRISEGLFTRPIKIGPRAVGWPASEVSAINAARISGKTDEQIRELVLELEAIRKFAV